MRDIQHQLPNRGNVGDWNPCESGGAHSSQMPQTGQQHYPSQPLRRHSGNRDGGSGDPLGYGRYPHRSGGCGGPYGTPGCGNGSPPDDPYTGGSDSSSSSEFERWCGHDSCSQQHDQYKQNMIAMKNSLVDLLQCQQRTQDNTTYALQVTHQSQREHANNSLINDTPIFNAKPE